MEAWIDELMHECVNVFTHSLKNFAKMGARGINHEQCG